MAADRLLPLCTVVLLSCLVLGGGTRAGFLSDVVIQLLAIPLLLVALHRLTRLPSLKHARWALALCLAIVLVPLLQLVPLPPALWTALPGREPAAEAFGLMGHKTGHEMGIALAWMPLSLSPGATWLSLVSLLPPLAVFLGMLLLGYPQRRILSLILIAFGVLSAFVGLLQVAQGPSSSLRFFAITNPSEAVGFFANRNHFAASLYAITVLAAAWTAEAAAPPAPGGTRLETRWIVPLAASLAVLAVLVAAQAMARSRAGLGLTIAALIGATAIAFCHRRNGTGAPSAKLLVGATLLAVVFAAQFTLYRIMDRFAADPLDDSRLTMSRLTADAAWAYMPFGTGMGTFVPVYGMQERPENAVIDTYVNRAHNDFFELWLETGVVGLALMALAFLWIAARSVKLWRRDAPGTDVDASLARAATVVVALIAAHSVVDYPLRTGGIMAIVAFACGLLIPPLASPSDKPAARSKKAHADSARPVRPPSIDHPQTAPIPPHSAKRWGNDVEWPEEWR